MAKTYMCPVEGCARRFTAKEKQPGGYCPCGRAKLKIIREKKEGKSGFVISYAVDEGEKVLPDRSAKIPKKKEEKKENPNDYGTLISDKGVNPETWITKEIDGVGERKNEYLIIYRNVIYQGWIHCPGCWNPLVMNNQLHNTHLDNTHKCRNCKSSVKVLCIQNTFAR